MARAVSRAMVDADRSIIRGRRDDRDVRRYPSPDPEPRYRDRSRDRDRYGGDTLPRLSDEDFKRYEFLQKRREERELQV